MEVGIPPPKTDYAPVPAKKGYAPPPLPAKTGYSRPAAPSTPNKVVSILLFEFGYFKIYLYSKKLKYQHLIP